MEEIKNLINALNKIYSGQDDWFKYEVFDKHIYIYGQENYLASLFSFLWGKTTSYALYLEKDEISRIFYIHVYKIYD